MSEFVRKHCFIKFNCWFNFIDNVYSGGSAKDGKYPLLSEAIEGGLFHPRCKDSTSTYYEGITTLKPVTDDEINGMKRQEKLENKQQYCNRQAQCFDRMAKYSLDKDNKRVYSARADEWHNKAEIISKEVEKFDSKSVETVAKPTDSGIITKTIWKSEGEDVHSICKIDKEIYKCVTSDIQTDEVIITDTQIEHIKERHPNDYERYFGYVKEIIEHPDYILEANKPNTAFILKHIIDNNKNYQLILRIKTSNDPVGYKNSVITFLKVEDKRYRRYLRTKKILYKNE